MKKLALSIVVFPFSLVCCYSQTKLDHILVGFTTNNLIGVWQRDRNDTLNDLGQNFQFFKDGHFILNIYHKWEDVQNVIALKGKYRLTGDSLYFTILSKVEIIGDEIKIADESLPCLFEIQGGESEEVAIKNPHEFQDPIYIGGKNFKDIYIRDEHYYMISNDPDFKPK